MKVIVSVESVEEVCQRKMHKKVLTLFGIKCDYPIITFRGLDT